MKLRYYIGGTDIRTGDHVRITETFGTTKIVYEFTVSDVYDYDLTDTEGNEFCFEGEVEIEFLSRGESVGHVAYKAYADTCLTGDGWNYLSSDGRKTWESVYDACVNHYKETC